MAANRIWTFPPAASTSDCACQSKKRTPRRFHTIGSTCFINRTALAKCRLMLEAIGNLSSVIHNKSPNSFIRCTAILLRGGLSCCCRPKNAKRTASNYRCPPIAIRLRMPDGGKQIIAFLRVLRKQWRGFRRG